LTEIVGDTAADPARAHSALRWGVLGLAALAIFSSYYESDAIGTIADLLGRQRGFTQSQIGDLTAVISLPSILIAVVCGRLIDRFGAARISLWAAIIGLAGAVLTAIGEPYDLMWSGRLLFGVSEGTIFIALLKVLAEWFPRSGIALASAVFLSLARVGSYSLDKSPIWARPLYSNWQSPLWLGAGITAAGLLAAVLLRLLDAWHPLSTAAADGSAGAAGAALVRTVQRPRFEWRSVARFDRSFWYILGLHVLYAAVFFPFRQTYAIEYLQHAKGLSLQQAGNVNSGVFAAAVFATPLFGLLADRFGHRALLLVIGSLLLPVTFVVLGLTELSPWVSTVLMGVSFAMVPAIIWPSTTLIVEPKRLGIALGLITQVQALALWGSNRLAGLLADAAHAGPAHPQGYSVMLVWFGAVSLTALTSALLLWRRERGPQAHGLELARPRPSQAPRASLGGS